MTTTRIGYIMSEEEITSLCNLEVEDEEYKGTMVYGLPKDRKVLADLIKHLKRNFTYSFRLFGDKEVEELIEFIRKNFTVDDPEFLMRVIKDLEDRTLLEDLNER